MFVINEDKSIYLTRGDVAILSVTAKKSAIENYTFAKGDIVRFKVFEKKNCENVVMQKDTRVSTEGTAVEIQLTKEDTTIGELINKPVDYWYEVELNPDTAPQTIVGYDEDGAKVFRLYPEGGNMNA